MSQVQETLVNHQSVQVLDLRHRLNDQAIPIEELAAEASRLFRSSRSAAHERWLELELTGYGTTVDRAPLHVVLGVPESDRLAVHVASYRAQSGRVYDPAGPGPAFRHFFVEPLGEISRAAERCHAVAGELVLDFGPGLPSYPTSAVFAHDVFDRILLGFRAVLHLQLGGLAV